jgi:hypothetical protein
MEKYAGPSNYMGENVGFSATGEHHDYQNGFM